MEQNGITPENRSLAQRLQFDAAADLKGMVRAFREKRFGILPSPMKEHFRIAREKPSPFINHRPVLALSIGGSHAKVMIARMQNGTLVVEHVRATPNPLTPTPLPVFLEEMLLKDKQVAAFLRQPGTPCIGFSGPVPMPLEGVFHHISKVPGITGFLARDLQRDAHSHHFGKNFIRFLLAHNLKMPVLFYYSDTVVAHQGGMSLCHLSTGDKTILLVCGTGLATCDETSFVITGHAPLLNYDEELYPIDTTEGHQCQFAAAGKGLFSLMERAIHIKAREPGSALEGFDPREWFATTHDSRTVGLLWQSTFPGQFLSGKAALMAEQVCPAALGELKLIASAIMERAVSIIASSGIGTMVHMGPPENGNGHIFFIEGSVVKDPFVLPLVTKEMCRLVKDRELFRQLEVPQLATPELNPKMATVLPGAGVDEKQLEQVDFSLIGAATSVMAQSCMGKLPVNKDAAPGPC
jgi:hypothetical protein